MGPGCVQVLSSPAAASACVCVTHALLRDPAFFADAVCLAALPHLLLLLLRAAGTQALLRPRVLRAAGDALRAVGGGRAEHAKGLLHLYIHLLTLGHVEVLEHARRWAADADVSLVRYFVLQVCPPPRAPSAACFRVGGYAKVRELDCCISWRVAHRHRPRSISAVVFTLCRSDLID